MANDYKVTAGKPPVVSAVFIPFRRTLLAIAAMMERQAVRHKLQGAVDPYQEWRQLPNAQAVLLEAFGRHALDPWGLNTKDAVGDHPGDLHLLHALWGAMAAHEKYLEAEDAKLLTATMDLPDLPELGMCCDAPDARPLHVPSGADWRERQAHGQVMPKCQSLCTHDGRTYWCTREEAHTGRHESTSGERW